MTCCSYTSVNIPNSLHCQIQLNICWLPSMKKSVGNKMVLPQIILNKASPALGLGIMTSIFKRHCQKFGKNSLRYSLPAHHYPNSVLHICQVQDVKSHIRAHLQMSTVCLTWVPGLRVNLVPLLPGPVHSHSTAFLEYTSSTIFLVHTVLTVHWIWSVYSTRPDKSSHFSVPSLYLQRDQNISNHNCT